MIPALKCLSSLIILGNLYKRFTCRDCNLCPFVTPAVTTVAMGDYGAVHVPRWLSMYDLSVFEFLFE